LEEEGLYEDLPVTTAIEKDCSRCNDSCSFELVENIPYDLAFEINSTAAKPLYQAWTRLLDIAQEKIHVASYYWSLTGKDVHVNDSSSKQGEDILKRFEKLLSENVSVYVATSVPTLANNSTDLQLLEEKGAQVRKINFGQLSGGVLHSKFWIVDMKHIYIGSANMDWRSLSQVKSAAAYSKKHNSLPRNLSPQERLSTTPSTSPTPLNLTPFPRKNRGSARGLRSKASPPVFCPEGRTYDLSSIISIISEAEKFVYVSVMEYFPTSRFIHPERY
ncbi:PLD4 Phospholipase, partial [Tricholaema leucomelas]|nr:PLD4 Phospholipase [Tricholaema leucomelas]